MDQDRSTGNDKVTHKYTGQELDQESELYYYNARYYDPSIGRFLTADTVVPDPENLQSFNRYTYVLNNPIKYTDPTGHKWWDRVKRAVKRVSRSIKRSFRKAKKAVHRWNRKYKISRNIRYGAIIQNSKYELGSIIVGSVYLAKYARKYGKRAAEKLLNRRGSLGNKETRAIINKALNGKTKISALSIKDRKLAARYYRNIVKNGTKGRYKDAAAKFNRLRADYMDGKTNEVPGTLREFMKRHKLTK